MFKPEKDIVRTDNLGRQFLVAPAGIPLTELDMKRLGIERPAEQNPRTVDAERRAAPERAVRDAAEVESKADVAPESEEAPREVDAAKREGNPAKKSRKS